MSLEEEDQVGWVIEVVARDPAIRVGGSVRESEVEVRVREAR
jgi:hypothetical protein